MLDRLQRCMKNRYDSQRSGRLAWEFIKRGERPPNYLWKDSIDPDPECVPILFAVGVFFALVMASLGYVFFAALLNNFTPLGVNVQTIAAGVMFSMTLAFVVYASVRMLHPTRRRRAAMIYRIRWIHRRFRARANSEPATKFEQWLVNHTSDDFGSALRILGRMLKWSPFIYMGIMVVVLVIGKNYGQSVVPSWLTTFVLVLVPLNTSNVQIAIFTFAFTMMALLLIGKAMMKLGQLITDRKLDLANSDLP